MTDNKQQPEVDENKLIAQRREKLAALRKAGVAFPNDFRRNVMAGELHAEYGEKSKEELEELGVRASIAGRMMLKRVMGKASFATVQDMSGRIQLYVTRDNLPEGFYNEQFKKWDLGDIIGAEGQLMKTNKGELSVKVDNIRLLTKALRPLPEKFQGLSDQETRYRQRYLDLIMNEESRNTFVLRSKIIGHIREFLNNRNFLEVETPMMQVIPGGATARPFTTFHNALDMDLYLRISPELYLKRLVVGGFDRVFEINRNFRNEGLSTRHNPEFTMIEFYETYATYHDLMNMTEEMLRSIAQNVMGETLIHYQGEEYDFEKPFARMTVKESILHFN
ncbi:MAG TPA: lysine--tRNA ligase, partial [Gammaproteobacteria bacterium]|nr:lysine--tRNA ligase [Gammaproteobacteria bacterium]